jgi:hypothetical protein
MQDRNTITTKTVILLDGPVNMAQILTDLLVQDTSR